MKTSQLALLLVLLSGSIVGCSRLNTPDWIIGQATVQEMDMAEAANELDSDPTATSQPTPEPALGLLALIKSYEEAANEHSVDTLMALFSEDAEFEMVGQATLPNLVAIRALHEYDKGIDTRLAFHNCTVAGMTVRCEVRENNDWLAAAGLGEIFYPTTVFTLAETGHILRIVATLSTEDSTAMGNVLAEFIPWLMAERPEETAVLFSPEGLFVYSEANGVLVVDLLKQWRAER